jgi:hypothetical protein
LVLSSWISSNMGFERNGRSNKVLNGNNNL